MLLRAGTSPANTDEGRHFSDTVQDALSARAGRRILSPYSPGNARAAAHGDENTGHGLFGVLDGSAARLESHDNSGDPSHSHSLSSEYRTEMETNLL